MGENHHQGEPASGSLQICLFSASQTPTYTISEFNCARQLLQQYSSVWNSSSVWCPIHLPLENKITQRAEPEERLSVGWAWAELALGEEDKPAWALFVAPSKPQHCRYRNYKKHLIYDRKMSLHIMQSGLHLPGKSTKHFITLDASFLFYKKGIL